MLGIDTLKKKAREWAETVVDLYHTEVPPKMQPEKDKLLKRAKTIKDTIEKVTGPLDSLAPLTPIANELGAFWVPIGVAVGVGAAATAIGLWYSDHRKFMERVAMDKRLAAENVPASQRAALIAKILGDKSLAENLFSPQAFMPLAVVTVFGIWLWTNRGK